MGLRAVVEEPLVVLPLVAPDTELEDDSPGIKGAPSPLPLLRQPIVRKAGEQVSNISTIDFKERFFANDIKFLLTFFMDILSLQRQ